MRRLVVVYDVSELSLAEISNLEVAAIVQAEAEKGVAGRAAHPAVRVRSFVAEDAMVEEIDLTVDRSRRTWPTNDEMRAEGLDPDTGVPRNDLEDDLRTLRAFVEMIDVSFPSTRVDSALAAVARLEEATS